jgi:peptide/nickel transport system substrate-binding protein
MMQGRHMILLTALLALFLVGGELFAQAPSAVSQVKPTKYQESPMLAAKVKAGQLPPLEQRLPADPLVQVGPEGNGYYSEGPLRVISNEANKLGDGRNAVTVASFVLPDYDGATLRPHLLKSWTISPDKKVLTLNLRKGVKWSDGVEFTSEDIRFWWEDVMNNKDLNTAPATVWITASGPMKVEVVDTYTVRWICGDPNPDLIINTVEYSGNQLGGTFYPSHYSRQFHKKYADPAKLEALIKEKGYASWAQLFTARNVAYWDAQSADTVACPTLNSHMVTKVGPNFIELERNPYYWKVDAYGRQLPYVDKIYVQVVGTAELYTAKLASGEADFGARRTNPANLPAYKNGEAAGKYRTRIWQSVGDGDYVLMMNFNDTDPVKRNLIQNLTFRKAISAAIDRVEFNKNRSFGLGVVSQIPMPLTSRFMTPEIAKTNTAYDVDLANRLLDGLGLKWDANHEYRLRSDGKRLSFGMNNGGERPIEGDELLAAQLKKIGIEVVPQLLARDLHNSRLTVGDFDFHMRKYGMLDVAFAAQPDMAIPISMGMDIWAPAWSNWYIGQVTGTKPSTTLYEEPPALVKSLIQKWNRMRTLPSDSAEYVTIGKELLKAQADNLWVVGILTGGPQPVIVSNRMGNVLENGIYTYQTLIYAQYSRADSWYIKQ